MISNKIARGTKYSFLSLAIATITVALMWGALSGKADTKSGNKLGIDPDCYAIYLKATKLQGQSEAEIMALADSMYTLAEKKGDTKAQCLALSISTTYYESAGPDASNKLRYAVDRQARFAYDNKYPDFFYNGLSTLILHYISYGNYNDALTEIGRMQDMAFKKNNVKGVGESHYLMSQLYQSIGMNQAAIQELNVGLNYIMDHGYTNDEYKFFYSLLQQYNRAGNIDSALVYIEKLQDDPMTTASQHIYTMLTLATHYRKQGRWNELKNQLQLIEKRKISAYIPKDYQSLYLQNKAIYLSHAQGDSAEALRLCQDIRVKSIKYDTQREIFQHFGNYRAAFEAKKKYYKQTSRVKQSQLIASTKTIDAIIKTNHLKELQKQSEFEARQLQLRRDSIDRLHAQYQLQLEQQEAARRAEEYNNLQTRLANLALVRQQAQLQQTAKRATDNARHAKKTALRAERQSRNLLSLSIIAVLVATLVIMAIRLRSRNMKVRIMQSRTIAQHSQTKLKDTLLLNLRDDLQQPIQELRDRVTIISGMTNLNIAALMSKAIHERTDIIINLVDEMIEKAEENDKILMGSE